VIVRRCLHRNQPGAYQFQAAINAVHADAAAAAQTDWPRIAALYDQLLAVAPTPVVALNRAIAIGEVQGRDSEATAAYERAASMAPTPAERDFLRLGGRASR
jgi:RNA polymerase sigma-70 factor (ECF subfamily)